VACVREDASPNEVSRIDQAQDAPAVFPCQTSLASTATPAGTGIPAVADGNQGLPAATARGHPGSMHKISGLRDPAAAFPLPGGRDDAADRRQANRAVAGVRPRSGRDPPLAMMRPARNIGTNSHVRGPALGLAKMI
jgi:hypothetical protein